MTAEKKYNARGKLMINPTLKSMSIGESLFIGIDEALMTSVRKTAYDLKQNFRAEYKAEFTGDGMRVTRTA